MKSNFALKFASCTDQGLVRKENQDYHGKFPENSDDLSGRDGQLFIVADGMGGHLGGQQASKMAVDHIRDSYFANPVEEIAERLRRAFEVANTKIHQLANDDPKLHGMGTTCTAVVFKNDQGFIAHVGDSRAYRINKSKIETLTRDHSQVAEMQRQGILTEKEAKDHPQRSVLTRALGILPEIEVDIIAGIPLNPGDRFLLCSDGLSKVDEEKLKRIVFSQEPNKACQKLIELANEAGGEDNVTVQVIQIQPSGTLGEKLKTSLKSFWRT